MTAHELPTTDRTVAQRDLIAKIIELFNQIDLSDDESVMESCDAVLDETGARDDEEGFSTSLNFDANGGNITIMSGRAKIKIEMPIKFSVTIAT